jgi:hypothetical protein
MFLKPSITALAISTAALLGSACNQQHDGQSSDPSAQHHGDDHEVMADSGAAQMPRSASPDGARVFFVTPADGDTVSSPVRVEFGIEGMQVLTAGDNSPDSGHHHLLIDTGLPEMSMPIPADANHVHFGDGSTETELSLEPGQHTLQLLLGDHLHVPHEPPVFSAPITIRVE